MKSAATAGAREAFHLIAGKRRSARSFIPVGSVSAPASYVDGSLIGDVCEALALSQRSPSGFNLQPYRAVVVRDDLVRGQLAQAMMGGNIRRILHAPVTVVWLADLEPWRLIDAAVAAERASSSATELELRNLSADAHFLLGGLISSESAADESSPPSSDAEVLINSLLKKTILGLAKSGVSSVMHGAEAATKRALMGALSHVTQAPTINSNSEAWSFKNTMLAVQTYLLAMDAFGWESCAMEGFDARRVKKIVGAPDERFSVPIVVSSGLSDDPASTKEAFRPRFKFEEVFSRDSLVFPLYKEDHVNNTSA